MDQADALQEADPAAPASRRSTGQRLRVGALLVAVLAVGVVAGVRVAEKLHRPAAGDRYQVAYEGDDGCGNVSARADGLRLEGQTDLSRPPVTTGHGTLVLDRVWDLTENDGLGASAILTLADGTKVTVKGGAEGKVFSTMPCAIRE